MFGNVTLGNFSKLFISSSSKMTTRELVGIGFVIIAVAFYWGKFLNHLPMAGD